MSTSVDGPSGPVDLVFGERLSDQGDQKLNVATIQTKGFGFTFSHDRLASTALPPSGQPSVGRAIIKKPKIKSLGTSVGRTSLHIDETDN